MKRGQVREALDFSHGLQSGGMSKAQLVCARKSSFSNIRSWLF